MLAGFGGGHLDDLAGTSLQDHKAVFAQGAALLGVGGGGPGIASCEINIWICHYGVFKRN